MQESSRNAHTRLLNYLLNVLDFSLIHAMQLLDFLPLHVLQICDVLIVSAPTVVACQFHVSPKLRCLLDDSTVVSRRQ
jgi:hypothetical protein